MDRHTRGSQVFNDFKGLVRSTAMTNKALKKAKKLGKKIKKNLIQVIRKMAPVLKGRSPNFASGNFNS